jgi:hypothetical protein
MAKVPRLSLSVDNTPALRHLRIASRFEARSVFRVKTHAVTRLMKALEQRRILHVDDDAGVRADLP